MAKDLNVFTFTVSLFENVMSDGLGLSKDELSEESPSATNISFSVFLDPNAILCTSKLLRFFDSIFFDIISLKALIGSK